MPKNAQVVSGEPENHDGSSSNTDYNTRPPHNRRVIFFSFFFSKSVSFICSLNYKATLQLSRLFSFFICMCGRKRGMEIMSGAQENCGLRRESRRSAFSYFFFNVVVSDSEILFIVLTVALM